MISELLDRLFPNRINTPSSAKVKQRLKFILAHDRAALTPQMFDEMRREIMQVVSKYVELDEDSLDIRLESDQRNTIVVANLPIRAIRDEPQEPAPEVLPASELELSPRPEKTDF
ncbi:cell division topological specificity factor MinE [Tumidithrix elongata RA019]|uniref:Cell division topological specificity factor n=1 Tax=Tumidithrix elongata BACA0141 TaxID=2716417 RepID=A0AAW9Q623_9CYAN|nr:cell division topological specificity factor MinE [Tumidithrix elongata RA019]